MLIDFGPRIWGLGHPAYGSDGTIRFSVQLDSIEGKGEEVTATLEGYLETPFIRNMIFLSQDIPMASVSRSRHRKVREFSVQIPQSTTLQGLQTPVPPSFMLYDLAGLGCDVKYHVKVHLTGLHGIRVKHDETKTVTIYYLPKSQPSKPPVTQLRRPLRDMHGTILCPEFQNSERTKTITLCPKPPRAALPDASTFQDSVFLTLPSSLSFTAGQTIPYLFSFVFPTHPHLSTLYSGGCAEVVVKKRLNLSHPRRRISLKGFTSRCTPDCPELERPYQLEYGVACSHPKHHSEYEEGVAMLRGSVETGDAGSQCSWRLGAYASVEFVLRASIQPPERFADVLPSFEHEEILELSTDLWGTLQRELSSMGGVPTPAVGLRKNQCPDTSVLDSRIWTI
ncbi:hypothetical protein AAF712_014131 [Marasmius tenuissimus]|uniref:Arrestin-like N-terminal domain-containing protein n=1 Tax=Marasmius tenuissimus TaxID=585030 RepID=A0ABR2ZE00_9AGAR